MSKAKRKAKWNERENVRRAAKAHRIAIEVARGGRDCGSAKDIEDGIKALEAALFERDAKDRKDRKKLTDWLRRRRGAQVAS